MARNRWHLRICELVNVEVDRLNLAKGAESLAHCLAVPLHNLHQWCLFWKVQKGFGRGRSVPEASEKLVRVTGHNKPYTWVLEECERKLST